MSRPDPPGPAGFVAVAGQKDRRRRLETLRARLRFAAQCRVQSCRGWTNARTARLGRGRGKTFWLSAGEKRRSEAPAYRLSKLRLRPRQWPAQTAHWKSKTCGEGEGAAQIEWRLGQMGLEAAARRDATKRDATRFYILARLRRLLSDIGGGSAVVTMQGDHAR